MRDYTNLNCLIVDDYTTARRSIKKSLIDLGFNCYEAENGEKAYDLLQLTKINLVIADVKMPVMNGLKLLENIRDDDNLKDIPVIITVIEALESEISEGEDLGMNDYLVKPFDVFSLSKVLDKVITSDSGESL